MGTGGVDVNVRAERRSAQVGPGQPSESLINRCMRRVAVEMRSRWLQLVSSCESAVFSSTTWKPSIVMSGERESRESGYARRLMRTNSTSSPLSSR